MAKVLLVLAVIIAIYIIFFRKKPIKNSDENETSFEMVECKVCKTYTPKQEAIKKGDSYFCSVKCLERS